MKSVRKYIKEVSSFMSLLILTVSCSQYDYISADNNVNNNYTSSGLFKKSSIENYSGEEIFKGIFFAKGEIADGLLNIKNSYSYYLVNNLTQVQDEKYESEIASVTNEINQKYPSYFSDFKRNIESGSHILITETIDEGAKKLFEAYVDKYISNNDKEGFVNALKQVNIDNYISSETGDVNYDQLYDDLENNPDFQTYFVNPGFIGLVLVAALYVLVVHAVAAMTYVYAAWVAQSYAAITKAKVVTRSKSISNKSIDGELLINEIAENLVKL